MVSVLIRDVDDALHKRLEASAARHSRSLEDEARELLRLAVARQDASQGEHIIDAAERLFGEKNGFDLDIPPRDHSPERVPPRSFQVISIDVPARHERRFRIRFSEA